jgi:D-alanyl-lipoteichoic acid acyltransferase DltB (MBOAT superfamily)
LRDYLYIPLGGNRGGEVRMYRNLLLTMLLGGLWHGAAWHFVAWGAYHGFLLILFRLIAGNSDWFTGLRGTPRLFAMVIFFTLTLGGWLLFRVNQLSDIPTLMGNIFHPWMWSGKLAMISVMMFAGPLMVIEAIQERRGDMLAIKRLAWPVRYAIYCGLVFAILTAGARDSYEFIYFQF